MLVALYFLIVFGLIAIPNFILYDFFTKERKREELDIKNIIIRIDSVLILLYLFLFILFQSELIFSEIVLNDSNIIFELIFVAFLFLILDMFIIYINKYINYKISIANKGIDGLNQTDENNKKVLKTLLIEIIIAIILAVALVFVFKNNELFNSSLSIANKSSGITSNKLAEYNTKTTVTHDVNQFASHGADYSGTDAVRNPVGTAFSIIITVSYTLVFILYIKSIIDYIKKEIKVNISDNDVIADYRKKYERNTKYLLIGITLLFICATILNVVSSFPVAT